MERYVRTEMLIGTDALNKLKDARVAVFGAGGVGGYVIEALARSGVGTLEIIDNDTVAPSNLNRQIIATEDTLGILKTEAFEKRIHSINPEINVILHSEFYLPDKSGSYEFEKMDYIVDAIDTVTAKIDLILQAKGHNVPIISSMGCGNRLDPSKLKICDLFETKGDPLARIMRHELRKRGVSSLCVVCSDEKPITPKEEILARGKQEGRRSTPGSSAFVPSAAGLYIASKVCRDLCGLE
ncbi:MAG: tRNA threonylcarbamoyladenosine dehydratase [Solobacterium sp.]|nr:tRNA threonylcarbamoyladenosine dehydratase [Solobacterium sp.]